MGKKTVFETKCHLAKMSFWQNVARMKRHGSWRKFPESWQMIRNVTEMMIILISAVFKIAKLIETSNEASDFSSSLASSSLGDFIRWQTLIDLTIRLVRDKLACFLN